MTDQPRLDDDERRLAELGYSQELSRTWSGFSNFAISFSIISILAGCFTTFGQAWNNGGPIAISIGWPAIAAFILVIGLCMSELVSAYPTSGGIYWWASKLGGPKAGYYTGWLNLVGNVAVLASVAYGCATFIDLTLSTYSESYLAGYSLTRVFVIFVGVLAVVAIVNIFRSQLLAHLNNVSVWWHVLGAAAVIVILVLLPPNHQSPAWVFTARINNSGYGEGWYWFLVLPLGFLLTQYTITGYDASAHLSEETRHAADAAARGIWQSIFYSAVGGWVLLLAHLNNVSVWWHVLGAAAVIVILVLLPPSHQSPAWVFTTRINNSGYGEGWYWFLVLPLGFLLTQYTITGYDASAHLSEETRHAADAAARGIWQSIFYSAIGGWVLLLSFLFAVQDEAAVSKAGGSVAAIFTQALSSSWAATVLGIAAIGQFFCSMASMTSTSRMLFAFSRDRGVPGWQAWSRLSRRKVPANAVLIAALVAFLLTVPALVRVDINGAPVPVAFYAVVSIAVVGLYLSFLIPIWLRLRAGSSFTPGPWTLGRKYKWMGWVAVIEIVVITFYALLPLTPAGIPFNDAFGLEFVNYAPIVTGGTLLVLWIAWHVSVKHWFTGPRTTIDTPVATPVEGDEQPTT